MVKKLQVIQATRHGHICAGCDKRIAGRMPAIALVTEDQVGQYANKIIKWFHNMACFNEFEAVNFSTLYPERSNE